MQDPEGKWVSGPKAWRHLTASEGNGIHVGPKVCAVLVEIQSVALEAAPAFLPAVVHQHIQVAWERVDQQSDLPTAWPEETQGRGCTLGYMSPYPRDRTPGQPLFFS